MSDRVGRRGFLRASLTGALATTPFVHAHAASVVATRIWPAADYTRVTIEVDRALIAQHQLLTNPLRLVLDLPSVGDGVSIESLSQKVLPQDPYIQSIEFGHSRPGSTRLIFNLKAAVAPELFNLAPIAQYQHRLVLDLHPVQTPDPLVTLLNQQLTDKQKPVHIDPLAKLIEKSSQPPAPKISLSKRRRDRHAPRKKPAPINRRITIAIDAGHGGEDPGALGSHGTYEKNVVLPIAAELRALIRRESGMRAYMTREGDYFVPLDNRVDKARRVSADLFVSIHADAAKRREAKGASVYVLSPRSATSAAAQWLADQENRSDRIGGVKTGSRFDGQARRLLLEMSAKRRSRDSKRLASNVLNRLGRVSTLHKPTIESAAFVVLQTPDIPSILVETAFLSNPDDEKRLRSPRFQREVARAIFDGIRDYLNLGAKAGQSKRLS